MEAEDLLTYFHDPAPGSYPGTHEVHNLTPYFFEIYCSSILLYMPNISHIATALIWSPQTYLIKSRNSHQFWMMMMIMITFTKHRLSGWHSVSGNPGVKWCSLLVETNSGMLPQLFKVHWELRFTCFDNKCFFILLFVNFLWFRV